MWINFNIECNKKVLINLNYICCIKFSEDSIYLEGTGININILKKYNEDFDHILWKLNNLGDWS